MGKFREWLREAESKEIIKEINDSDRDFIDNRLKTTFEKEGFKLPKNGPTVKIGYTLWPFADGFEVINDGVGIKVKKDGKELAYFDKPKLDYKKAVNFLIKSMKDLDEDEELISEKLDYKTFFAKKLEKFGVKSPAELSDEDKKKFFDEIENEWEGEKEEKPEADEEEVNERLQIKSRMSAMFFIKECIDLEKDSIIKNKLQSVYEFMSKEFKIPIED